MKVQQTSFSTPLLLETRAHLMGCNGGIIRKCKWGRQRTGQVSFYPWSQDETLDIRNLWNSRTSENCHLRNTPDATGKATVFEMLWKKNNLHFSFRECDKSVLSFPHCCLLLLLVFFARKLQRAGVTPRAALLAPSALCRADVLVLGKRSCWHCPCQPASLQTPSLTHTTTQVLPASMCTLHLCRNAGEQPHRQFHYILLSNFNYRRRSWIGHVGWLQQTAWFWLRAWETKWNKVQSLVYPL